MKRRGKNICGGRIKDARLSKGWTQLELSDRLPKHCKIGRPGIAKIEASERLVCDFELLAFSEVLGKSCKWLLTRC